MALASHGIGFSMVSLDWIPDQNYTIDLSITPDGAITVSNSRNRITKMYQARGAR